MALPRFFPETKIHQFNYNPRYYDAQKEEVSRRYDEIKKEMGEPGTEDIRLIQKGTFRRRFERQRKDARQSSLRIFVTAIILGLIVYFVNRYFGFF
ncbi:MAG: hypothetical protein IKQ46_09435 [Bacteroidales bacterium]|nr:hypothetical protein [Bacteroidales bacterium]